MFIETNRRCAPIKWLRAVAALFFLCGLPVISSAEPPNILLIVADDLGFSDLGCYGGEIETPELDQLAKDGVRLTQFYTTGRCSPSRAAILTGLYPHRVGLGHHMTDIGRPGYRGSLSDEAVTIAQVLSLAGYRSFMSGKWHLGTPDPTKHGFEEYFGTLLSAFTFWDPARYLRLPADRKRREYRPGEFYGTNALTDHALDFISLARRTPERPWFLYLAYNAPHFPLHAPKETIAKYANVYARGWDVLREERLGRTKKLGVISPDTKLSPRSPWWNYGETEVGWNPAWSSLPSDRRADLSRRMAIYAAMVDRMDENIGRLVSDLKTHGEIENTLIVFLSDNGACAEWDPNGFDVRSSNNNVLHVGEDLEQMGGPGTFHSAGSGWANLSNTPLRLYKHFNHEGGVSTPMIVHWPDRLGRRGTVEHGSGHLVDLVPTFVEVAEIEYPAEFGGRRTIPLPGQSILPLLQGAARQNRPLFFEHEGHRAIREGSFKLVARRGRPWELYKIDEDRTESNDLSKQQPERVKAMEKRWDEWAKESYVTPLPEDYGVKYIPKGPSRDP